MCSTWDREEWLENSRPANPTSAYSLNDTRYNASGDTAHVFAESDGDFWGVLPGTDYLLFSTARYQNPRGAALYYLADHGFTLETPVQTTSIPVAELVENRA